MKNLSAYQLLKHLFSDIKELILNDYKLRGGSFSKWKERDMWLMLDSLTCIEDRFEQLKPSIRNQPKIDACPSIKTIRRALEDFLESGSFDWYKAVR